jgi:hypothetical protein
MEPKIPGPSRVTPRPPLSRLSKPRLLRVLFWTASVLMTAFVVGGFLLPKQMNVSRSITIRAPKMDVYDQFQSFKNWETWGPWFQRDPFLEKKIDGDSGMGAMMTWRSKTQGEGRIKILSAFPGQSLRMAVDSGQNGEANLSIDLEEAGENTTKVTWGFQSDFGQNMAKRYFALFFAGTVGDDLDEALANVKAKLEKGSDASRTSAPSP